MMWVIGRIGMLRLLRLCCPDLAERFRRYVAERYGLRRSALSRTIADLMARELTLYGKSKGCADAIVGLGLKI